MRWCSVPRQCNWLQNCRWGQNWLVARCVSRNWGSSCFACILLWIIFVWVVLAQLFLLVGDRNFYIGLHNVCCLCCWLCHTDCTLWLCLMGIVPASYKNIHIVSLVCTDKYLLCQCSWIFPLLLRWCCLAVFSMWGGRLLAFCSCQDNWFNFHPLWCGSDKGLFWFLDMCRWCAICDVSMALLWYVIAVDEKYVSCCGC